jgi:hypothetical protein
MCQVGNQVTPSPTETVALCSRPFEYHTPLSLRPRKTPVRALRWVTALSSFAQFQYGGLLQAGAGIRDGHLHVLEGTQDEPPPEFSAPPDCDWGLRTSHDDAHQFLDLTQTGPDRGRQGGKLLLTIFRELNRSCVGVPQLGVFLREPISLGEQVMVLRIAAPIKRLSDNAGLPINRLATAMIRRSLRCDPAPNARTDGSRIV